ncbi:hypothetical protein [Massilia rubra]|uniref:Helicase/UvrB N-terminal domain-containing protein n=1 Tax=Massilia rubra TaxID=2607910 RepID=A0ABX0LTM9_9BURK|nr:hypothetical protein [Massilia rubra]NHZ33471.1 hypothetical protein [Massilia rubra]
MPKVARINRQQARIFKLGFEDPYRNSRGRAFIRLLNWYTGFGKTYTAACFSLHLFLTENVIPIFLAPLQSVVTGFAEEVRRHMCVDRFDDEIEQAIRRYGQAVPVYRLCSREFHINDRSFFQAVLLLVEWLGQQPVVYAALEKDLSNKSRGIGGSTPSLAAQLAECKSKCHVCLKSELHSMSSSNEDFEVEMERYQRAADKVLAMANRITRKVIDIDMRSRYHGPIRKLMSAPEVYDMVRRLYPLQAFADKPGMIIGTASKAAMPLQVLVYHEAEKRCKWVDYDSLFWFAGELNRSGNPLAQAIKPGQQRMRVNIFIDEEEDSYFYLFDQRMSVVNPDGRNDLNEVIGDFQKYFDLAWPFAFEHGTHRGLARKLFYNLWAFADVSVDVEQLLNHERVKTGVTFIAPERQIVLLREALATKWPHVSAQFGDQELGEVYKELIANHDASDGFERFRQKAYVLGKVLTFVKGLPRNGHEDDYQVFRKWRALVFEKKFFLMSRSRYGEMLDQPSQTFFNAMSAVMTSDYLNRVELSGDTGNRTIRLEYRDRKMKMNAFTLLHYLKFIILIADVLKDKKANIQFDKDSRVRYRNLYKFARDAGQLFKSHNHQDGLDDDALASDAVGEDFFFFGTKSIVSLDESERQATEYNHTQDLALTLSIVSLRDTPEEDLRNALGENNGIYLLSATGGLQPCSSGTFNQRRLQAMLKDIGGVYFPMTPAEVAVVAAAAEKQRSKRQRDVRIVDDALLAYRFPATGSFSGLRSKFLSALPSDGKHRHERMTPYKEQEVRGLVASLDRLLSTPLRCGMCLCLSMAWARACLLGLAQSTAFVSQVDTAGYHFVVDPLFLPQYRGNGKGEKIHIVLYAAGQFKKRDFSQTGAVAQVDESDQFSDEFLEALDVTDKKVLLWTAYRSAARGTNFIATRNGQQIDFELIYLINSPYYNRHTRPGTPGFHIETFQSMIQVLNDRPQGAQTMSRAEFLYDYARHRWEILEREHFMDLCRTLFQALGRVERRPDNFIERQEIYLDVEVAQTMRLGTRFAPELVQRASATQIAVLQAIADYDQQTALFAHEDARRKHVFASLRHAEALKQYTKQLPAQFRSSSEARQRWESMFDERMVTAPQAYCAHLRRSGVPAAYCDALYFRAPEHVALYSCKVDMLGKQQRIIADHVDGDAAYDWVAYLAPANLLRSLSSPFNNLRKFRTGFPDKNTKEGFLLVPQPWFVTDIIKGYLAEREFVHFAQREFGLDIDHGIAAGPFELLDALHHPEAAQIYQQFDFYFVVNGNVLLAIDIKNWTKATDHLKKAELERMAKLKQRKLARMFPQYEVHALYVNLYGAHKYNIMLQPGSGAISFMSMYVQGTLSREPWILNAKLAEVMLWSGS